jgi:hypothetical protein
LVHGNGGQLVYSAPHINYNAAMAKAPFLMRIYASGLQIEADRRDELYDRAKAIVLEYSQHRDRERAAEDIAKLGATIEEFRFLARAIDNVL